MRSFCRALYRLLKALHNSGFISVGCWEGIPPAWCKVGTTHSAAIPAVQLSAWGIPSGIKSAFFHFHSDFFQKGITELKKTTFIPSIHKELHQKTWCCFMLTFKASLCIDSHLKRLGFPHKKSDLCKSDCMTYHSRDILILCLSPPLHMDIH